MKKKVFSVFDVVAKVFGSPYLFVHEGEAIRALSDAVRREGTAFHEHPEDFRLFRLGEYDDNSGLFICGEPEFVANAVDYVVVKK